ncbi:Cpn60 TCP1 domain containing protein [Trichuris trichiura]|uniref:Cpn60 TCP1 domain containing protein n=1 Tax=Trichuris trichiura TaxID=36087 RepID=A0A077Z8A1_TRITR|nr:Cpn60 TCP1 domain containing protein [Trichuris trichiura]
MIDRYFTFVINDKGVKACALLLRSLNKDIFMEMDRNLQDELHVVGNVFLNPKVLPGGGATEMTLAQAKHTDARNETLDINGITGEVDDRNKLNVRNPLTVRAQTAILLMRIDEILSGVQEKTDADKSEQT